jgi:hypothetical protein
MEGAMPRKRIHPVTEPGLTQVFAVGDAEMRIPIIAQVQALGYSHWAAGSHKAAVNSFKNGLRAAVVVIAMTNVDDSRAFAAWVNENHPNTTVIFSSNDPNARGIGAKYVVPHAMLARELPRILAYDLEEPMR